MEHPSGHSDPVIVRTIPAWRCQTRPPLAPRRHRHLLPRRYPAHHFFRRRHPHRSLPLLNILARRSLPIPGSPF